MPEAFPQVTSSKTPQMPYRMQGRENFSSHLFALQRCLPIMGLEHAQVAAMSAFDHRLKASISGRGSFGWEGLDDAGTAAQTAAYQA